MLLRMEGIVKSFPGVKALRGAHLEVAPGEVHALMGENGAGKSTLMKVLGGVHPLDEGAMTWQDRPFRPHSPHQARQAGIEFIHQELMLAENLSVAENILLGHLPARHGVVDWKAAHQQAAGAAARLGVELPLAERAGTLNVGTRQMVEIARAMSGNASLIVMDEPTAALTEKEAAHLFDVIRRLREQGTAIVYISHRMPEVFTLSDRITVMRDGSTVGTWCKDEVTPDAIVRHMVGRDVTDQFAPRKAKIGEPVLEVEGLTSTRVHDISLTVRAGEIVGLAGLVGAGRTELARALMGADRVLSGSVKVGGQPVKADHPAAAIRYGIGYVTEDRKGDGLLLGRSIEENVALGSLARLSHNGFMDAGAARRMVDASMQAFKVRASGPQQVVGTLSGGNQQKVLMARWLALQCKVLILDEPTRGVDVGARAEIYALIEEMAEKGMALLLISSDLPELLGLSDRIVVIREGRVAGRFERAAATPEAVMAAALV